MSLGGEIYALMMSDVSAAALDQLVTRPGLFVRNTMIHFLVPFFCGHLWFHFPVLRVGLFVLALGYLLLQVVQLTSPVSGLTGFLWLVWDGVFDVFVCCAGSALSLWLAMREVPR